MDKIGTKTKSSWYLPYNYIEAMREVADKKRVGQSNQVELALKEYMKEHQNLLKDAGIDLWK